TALADQLLDGGHAMSFALLLWWCSEWPSRAGTDRIWHPVHPTLVGRLGRYLTGGWNDATLAGGHQASL
ncbi:MAG: hypothetical protein WEE53_00865, partial [Acidimicrobiia bacterium]